MNFIESPRFPEDVSFGSTGGPSYRTTIVEMVSGREKRNIEWSLPRMKYNAAFGVRNLSDLEDVLAYFHACAGRGRAFRFKDWADFKSAAYNAAVAATDQLIGIGDGAAKTFQLVKNYSVGTLTLARVIAKPVIGTVKIAVAGVEQSSGWTVNTTTGLVTFTAAPANLAEVRAGFEFDVPVRFDSDETQLSHASWQNGTLSLPLIEVRL